MKKLVLLGAAFLMSSAVYSQIFTDNFDSYNSGDFLVSSNPAWDTWSGGAGGSSEDVKISDVESASAPNSIHFIASSPQGGPSDVILRFDNVYTSGNFTLEFNMKVVQNKGAYFNLQQNHNVGEVWALQCYMLNNGNIIFDNGSTGDIMLQGSYPNGDWFNFKIDIDLTTNQWEVFIDGTSIGSFSNVVNSIGIWDIFPVNPTQMGGNGQSEFYIDDVSYGHVPATLLPLNAGVTFVKQIEGLAGQSLPVEAKIRNLGSDDINSFDISYTYAGGATVTESVSGITLNSLATYDYNFTAPLTLVSGSNPLMVTVSNVNGLGQDGDDTDDSKSIVINPIIPAAGKIVLGEEATGTWCGWCPRGAVFMDYMADKYDGFWAGVAVHNGDPMADAMYDAGMGTKIQGYPSAIVDRGASIDPSQLEEDFIQRILIAPKAVITNGASFNSTTRELEVSLTYSFSSAISGSWKVACILTEDGVTGTAGYAQNNSYAGGNNGVMGGYELLPSPVPASQMVYDHVARKIAPSFAGDASLLPSSISAGDEYTVCMTFTLPVGWDETKMNIIGTLIDPSGKVDNASYSTIADAENNGLAQCGTSGIIENDANEHSFNLYPNPATEIAYVDVANSNGEDVVLTVTDLTGKVVATRSYVVNDAVQLPINTGAMAKGTYIVHLQIGASVQQKKLVVK